MNDKMKKLAKIIATSFLTVLVAFVVVTATLKNIKADKAAREQKNIQAQIKPPKIENAMYIGTWPAPQMQYPERISPEDEIHFDDEDEIYGCGEEFTCENEDEDE